MSFIIFCVLIVSIIAHEVAHGIAALWQGDPTAKYAGRLSLNPISHIDMMGSIVVPLICVMSGTGVMFGWAKPVPINPYNFRNQRWGELFVAAAGPLINIIIALVFIIFLRSSAFLGVGFVDIAINTIAINVVLAIFNLIPVPPLDGSKILFGLLPQRYYGFKTWLERRGILIGFIVALIAWQFMIPFVMRFLNYVLAN